MYAYAWYEQCMIIYEGEAESFQTLLCLGIQGASRIPDCRKVNLWVAARLSSFATRPRQRFTASHLLISAHNTSKS
jgi:hypothetical protein